MIHKKPPQGFNPKFEAAACYVEQDGKILMLKRAPHLDVAPSTWALPGGKLEGGESSQEAMLRELAEESGISLDPEVVIPLNKFFVRYPDFDFIYHTFKASIEDPIDILLSDEHEEFVWVTLEESMEMDIIPGHDICVQADYFEEE